MSSAILSPGQLPIALPLPLLTVYQIFISNDSVLLTREPARTRKYAIGLYISFSAIALCFMLVIDVYASYHTRSYRPHTSHGISQASRWAQLVAALSLAVAGICLLRRPAVYQDGQVVDAQYTCSAIQR